MVAGVTTGLQKLRRLPRLSARPVALLAVSHEVIVKGARGERELLGGVVRVRVGVRAGKPREDDRGEPRYSGEPALRGDMGLIWVVLIKAAVALGLGIDILREARTSLP